MAVLKIKHGNTTYEFSKLDVKKVTVKTLQDQDVQILSNYKPIAYLTSDERHQLNVIFNILENVNIVDTIDTLEDVEDILGFELYYNDGTLAESFKVKIDPHVKYFKDKGGRADNDMMVTFYEAAELTIGFEHSNYPIGGSK